VFFVNWIPDVPLKSARTGEKGDFRAPWGWKAERFEVDLQNRTSGFLAAQV